jgi:RNA polymerase sigma-70 factor, ECF subfamily
VAARRKVRHKSTNCGFVLMDEFAIEPVAETDADLVQLAAGRDARAFEVLAGRYRDLMYAVCRRITCDDHDAVDALQEALLAAWSRIGSFEGRSAVSTWLFRIATNAAIDEVRRRSQRHREADGAIEERAGQADVEAAVVARSTVDWALARLPPQFRAAVVLREYYDLTYQQIADALDIPIDTVKSRISRGRQALADLLMPGFRDDPLT